MVKEIFSWYHHLIFHVYLFSIGISKKYDDIQISNIFGAEKEREAMALFGKSEFTYIIESGYRWSDKSEFFRDYYESMKGKRDAIGWFYGIIVPLIVVTLASIKYKQLEELSLPSRVMDACYTCDGIYISLVFIVCFSFFFGQRWARKAMFTLPFVAAILFHVIMDDILTNQAIYEATLQSILESIIGLIVYAAIISSSVPNKAFFRIPVDEKGIEKYWKTVSNKYVGYSIIAGILSPLLVAALIIFLTSLDIIEKGSIVAIGLALVFFVISCGLVVWLCMKAFENYAPNAIPPILGRGYAIFGLVALITVGSCMAIIIKLI